MKRKKRAFFRRRRNVKSIFYDAPEREYRRLEKQRSEAFSAGFKDVAAKLAGALAAMAPRVFRSSRGRG